MSSKIIDSLVSSAKNGSAEAFGELYEIYSRDMFRFAYYYLGSSALAEDCVSECVCIAYEKIGSLRKASAFKSWLFKILHNCCNSALREKIRSDGNVEYSALTDLSSESEDINEKLSLKQALSLLSDEDREIVILHYCQGYTSKEIGEILGIKDATVRSKILRSGEKLRKFLQK
ncbi:MAG: RNA polymerase sigma factor [Clostridia bacterium]|nr:RNA polymerase sigma factor [Clostridia bacterium]